MRELLVHGAGKDKGSPEVAAESLAVAGLQVGGPRRHFALPLMREGRQFGVLILDGEAGSLSGLEDREALGEFMSHIEAAMELATGQLPVAEPDAHPEAALVSPAPLKVRRFPRNDEIFVDGEYLIKGLAGIILWRLLREHERTGRVEFSNLELRLELAQAHPEKAENLESRMVTLIRRLEGRPDLRIQRAARGKFKLIVDRPLQLLEAQ